jgi:hypothetical protein
MVKPSPPSAEQLDHLIGHTDHRPLTPDEHAALRVGVRQLRASLAGTAAALRRASSGAFHQQVAKERLASVRAECTRIAAEIDASRYEYDNGMRETLTRVLAALGGDAPTQQPGPGVDVGHAGQSARSMLLNLLAEWGMRSGEGARAVVDEALRRHADEVTPCLVAEPAEGLPSLRVITHHGWTPPPTDAEIREQVAAILAPALEEAAGKPAACVGCGSPQIVYRNHLDQPLCCPCARCCPAESTR